MNMAFLRMGGWGPNTQGLDSIRHAVAAVGVVHVVEIFQQPFCLLNDVEYTLLPGCLVFVKTSRGAALGQPGHAPAAVATDEQGVSSSW